MTRPRNSLDKLGLGTWAFGGRAYGPMDDKVALAICDQAYHSGIRFFDTANIYAGGRSEEILGEALNGYDDVTICTKIGYDISSGKPLKNYSPEFLEASLDASLRRLRRERIELLLLHNPPPEVFSQDEVFQWLRAKVEQGRILKWGVSVYDSTEDAKLALGRGSSAIEARYSLIRRDILDDLNREGNSAQFIARSPLDGRLLSGKYSGGETFPKTDQRTAKNVDYIRANSEFLNELKLLLDGGIARSFAELAIRFAAFAPGVSKVIPGAKSVEQLEQNVEAVSKGPLPREAIALIDDLRRRYLSRVAG